MMTTEELSIALPSEMVTRVRQAVEQGEYASTSEVIHDALRDWTRQRDPRAEGIEHLQEVWQQALENSDAGIPSAEMFERLKLKYKDLGSQTAQ